MSHALVIGKFMPFHKGHQALIDFAAKNANDVSVLVCASDKESMSGTIRFDWLNSTYLSVPNIHIRLLNYNEDQLPNSSESSRNIAKAWADFLKPRYPEATMIVSSEPYGAFLAEYMGLENLIFDIDRTQLPVSATMIREKPWLHYDFLPEAVKPYYHRKIVLLGTESTGKSTLAKDLVDYFSGSLVPEAGRDLIPDSSNFMEQDLYRVAEAHQELVRKRMEEDKAILIMDTDIHITQSYSKYSFGNYLELPEVYYLHQKADLYLYLNADVPLVQDGTRLQEEERKLLDVQHRQTLKAFNISYEEIRGNWEERKRKAIELIQRLY